MRIVGQQGIADLFGVSVQTINNWQDDGLPIMVQGGPGVPSQYDSASCIKWAVQREVRKVVAETPKDRLYRLQAEDLEMKMAERKGLLIPASKVEPKITGAVIAAREKLRGEPPRLAALMEGLDKAGREALLREAFDEALRKLARWNETDVQAEAAQAEESAGDDTEEED